MRQTEARKRGREQKQVQAVLLVIYIQVFPNAVVAAAGVGSLLRSNHNLLLLLLLLGRQQRRRRHHWQQGGDQAPLAGELLLLVLLLHNTHIQEVRLLLHLSEDSLHLYCLELVQVQVQVQALLLPPSLLGERRGQAEEIRLSRCLIAFLKGGEVQVHLQPTRLHKSEFGKKKKG
jgi:hypothetical protein